MGDAYSFQLGVMLSSDGSSEKEKQNTYFNSFAFLVILHVFFCGLLIFFFKINFFEKYFHEYHQSVKQFGPRSGPTLCRAWSGSKLFAKFISRRHLVKS